MMPLFYISFLIKCECNELVEYDTYLLFTIKKINYDSYCGMDRNDKM